MTNYEIKKKVVNYDKNDVQIQIQESQIYQIKKSIKFEIHRHNDKQNYEKLNYEKLKL